MDKRGLKTLSYIHWLVGPTKYSTYAVVAAVEQSGIRARFVRNPLELNLKGKVLGVTLLTTMLLDKNFMNTLKLLVKKKEMEGFKLIAGGPHATGDPIGTLQLGFDYVILGEGEERLPRFLRGEEVDGIVYKEGDEVVIKSPKGLVDLDKFYPWPYWQGYAGPFEITRGCPFACFYCQTSFMFGKRVRHRSVDFVVELSKIMINMGMKDLRFISPNSLSYGGDGRRLELDKVEELLYKLSKLGGRIFFGSFPSEVRPEFVTEEAVKVMKKYVSNKRVIVGAQSGSERMLRLINRGHSVEDVENAVRILLSYGFKPEVDFILGLPYETEDDMEATLEFMQKIARMGAKAHLHYFMPLPGSPFAYAKPTKLSERIRKKVAKIVGEGKGYGQWMAQERIAWEIVRLREEGVILPRRRKVAVAIA